MDALGKRLARVTFASAVSLIGLGPCHSVLGGSLDGCDLARIAAHNAVLDAYAPVLSDLAVRSSAPALVDELKHQEAMDLGRADEKASTDCYDSNDPVEKFVAMAQAIAAQGIRAVLSRNGISEKVVRLQDDLHRED